MAAINSFEEYFAHIKSLLTKAKSNDELFEAIVNAPFYNKLHATSLDLGMIVLLLVNNKTHNIERIAHSKTQSALDAFNASPVRFEEIKIPLKNNINITAKAIRNGRSYKTSDWRFLQSPAISPEAARFNQAEAGIGCSFVYPLIGLKDGGGLVFSFYQSIDMIGPNHQQFMKEYSDFAALQLNNISVK